MILLQQILYGQDILSIKKLWNNENIAMLKTDEGRWVVLMDKFKYFEKSLPIVDTNCSIKLNKNLRKKNGRKVQRMLQKLKQIWSINKYKSLYAGDAFTPVTSMVLQSSTKSPIWLIISYIGTSS